MQRIQVLIIFHCHLVTVQPGVNCYRFIFCDIDCVRVCLSCLQIPGFINKGALQAMWGKVWAKERGPSGDPASSFLLYWGLDGHYQEGPGGGEPEQIDQ